MVNDELKRALQFTEDDLAANRRMTLTPHQAERVRARRKSRAMQYGAVIIAVVVAGLLVLVSASAQSSSFETTGFAVLMFGVALFFVWLLYDFWVKVAKDIRESRVNVVNGPVKPVASGNPNGGVNFAVTVGDVRFRATREEFLAFKNLKSARVYYAASAKVIVSAEALSK